MSKHGKKKCGKKKGGTSNTEKQAQALLKFAVEELGLSEDDLPSVTDVNTCVHCIIDNKLLK